VEDVDIDLVIRASSGDHDAFARLATSIASRFHPTAYAILREHTLAEEAARSALVNVWRDLPRLRDPSRFETWSYRILLNACFSVGRRANRGSPLRRPSLRPQLLS
jgi:RNA polymerase sigma-70 factor (ECF subfamily)